MLAPVSALEADVAELERVRAPAVEAPAAVCTSRPPTPSALERRQPRLRSPALAHAGRRGHPAERRRPPGDRVAIAAARGGGSPLDGSLAQSFGNALGHSVADVRVHTDSTAAALTRAVSARAFATGTDIFFAPGEYQPGTSAGRELIAHEVAHTDQQRGAPLSGPLVVSNPGEPLEVQADGVARELVS